MDKESGEDKMSRRKDSDRIAVRIGMAAAVVLGFILVLAGRVLYTDSEQYERRGQTDKSGLLEKSAQSDVGKKTDIIEEEKADINIITVGKEDVAANKKSEDEEREVIENPYFPANDHVSLKVHAEYYDRGFVDEIADAEINRIKIYEEGSVYKLTIYIVPMMSSWYFRDGENMSMYFYVTADKIYWILPYAQLEPGGKTIYFYDDDDLLVKTLDTDEKLKDKGVLELICQEEELQGESFSIMKEGNKVTYYYSETKVNGESGGEELFVWEKGKGLVEFGTGFGPGPLEVHIWTYCYNL